jgi:hypothetical protein
MAGWLYQLVALPDGTAREEAVVDRTAFLDVL